MRTLPVLAFCACTVAGMAAAQPAAPETSAPASAESGVPLLRLIHSVAKKTGKRFVVDPRVSAEVVLAGQDPASLTYADLVTVLHAYGFAAVEDGGYTQVVPDSNVRTMAIPTVTEKDTRPASEIVSMVVTVRNVSAAQLVPLLRPLMPQGAHLAASPCVNKLILVDTFSNVRRLVAIVRELDVGEPYKPKCE
ncbi:MAG: hypothetical protein JSR73_07090 [Proteobacteria bacterium]|nr:hypothetical protein [Pseudomonadota bacterium]